jgi:hypothetical protein
MNSKIETASIEHQKALEVLNNRAFFTDLLEKYVLHIDDKNWASSVIGALETYNQKLDYLINHEYVEDYDTGNLPKSINIVIKALDRLCDLIDVLNCDPQPKHFGKYLSLLNQLEILLADMKTKSASGIARFVRVDKGKHPYDYSELDNTPKLFHVGHAGKLELTDKSVDQIREIMIANQYGEKLSGVENIFLNKDRFIESRLGIADYHNRLQEAKAKDELSKKEREAEELSKQSFLDKVLPRGNSKKRIVFSDD